MIIIGLTDIHGNTDKLDRLKKVMETADLILLIGDLTNFGHKSEMDDLVSKLLAVNKNLLAVPGNCDFPETEQVLKAYDINLNGTHKTINSTTFIGLGASLATPSKATPFERPESYFEKQLAASVLGLSNSLPKILVSHQPPLDTKADAINPHLHVGSSTVRKFIEDHQPLVCFTGHIHEGQGVDQIGDTLVINPGPVFKGFYAYAEINGRVDSLEIRPIK